MARREWKMLLAVAICAIAAAASAQVQFRRIFRFDGADGVAPDFMFLTQGTDGNFYGTTESGGAYHSREVFKVTPSGAQTVLYSFCFQQHPPNCADGTGPVAGLVQASDGNFYGTTGTGGANKPAGYPDGAGTVFKITPSGALTTLYSFCEDTDCADGAIPTGALVQGSDGNLYGTTLYGGAYGFGFGGTVFKMTPDGDFTSLYSFCTLANCADGISPSAGGGALLQGTDGMFYGTTYMGGANDGGTVFKISASGIESVLYSFCPESGCPDGQWPSGGLAQGPDGDFYGATQHGGASDNGVVFKITAMGAEAALYSFCPNPMQGCTGANPVTGMTLSSNGDFAGTTYGLEASIYGITLGGKFEESTGANNTTAGLLQGTDGLFYGMAGIGGKPGSIFSLSVGLPAFVKTSPTFGPTATPVIILGTNLTGATAVTFNGTPATFTVVSATEITTNVPTGATSGRVKVTTLSGTLTSNLPFTVIQ